MNATIRSRTPFPLSVVQGLFAPFPSFSKAWLPSARQVLGYRQLLDRYARSPKSRALSPEIVAADIASVWPRAAHAPERSLVDSHVQWCLVLLAPSSPPDSARVGGDVSTTTRVLSQHDLPARRTSGSASREVSGKILPSFATRMRVALRGCLLRRRSASPGVSAITAELGIPS